MATSTTPSTWHRGTFMVSTSYSLLDHSTINEAFASEYMDWAKRLSPVAMRTTLQNSLCFGLYDCTDDHLHPQQIGLARIVTDATTFAYLTDVFVLPAYRGRGLGKWLMACVNETFEAWPHLRTCLLFAASDTAKAFYAQALGMRPFADVYPKLELMGTRKKEEGGDQEKGE